MRQIAIAIALMLGLAGPAAAQAPPPVPALPDAARLTTYSLTASTCACSVGFDIYGDATDVDAWIQVFINGVAYLSTDTTHGWVLTSATGPLGSIPRPITNAELTFNAPQTGAVAIVGDRRPRRISQFPEDRGVAARDLNLVITDIIATQREVWDKLNNVAAGGGGGGGGGGGVPILGAPSTGYVPTATSSAAAQWMQNPAGASILAYGAKCDGATNDSAAIQAALNANRIVSVPAAGNYCLVNTTVTIPTGASIVVQDTGINVNGTANCFQATTLSGDMFVIGGGYVSILGACFVHNGPSGSIIGDRSGQLGGNNFLNASFTGANNSNASALVYFNSGANRVSGSAFTNQRPNANAYDLVFDATGGHTNIGNRAEFNLFGGPSPGAGPGVFVGSTDASARNEGFFFKGNLFVQQGAANLWLDAVLSAHIEGNEFDQGSGNNVILNASSNFAVSDVHFVNNWFSTPTNTSSGVCVEQLTTTFPIGDITFHGNSFAFCGFGLVLGSNASGIIVQGNNFAAIGMDAIALSGTKNVIIDSNTFASVAPNFNYSITDTATAGPFVVTNNLFDPGGNANLTVNTISHFTWVNNRGGGANPAGLFYTIATLPTCNAAIEGMKTFVTNGQATPTFLGAVSATGAVIAPVFCNATAWVYG